MMFWPPNSPDLHPIENSFDYLKDMLDDFKTTSASQAEKKRAIQFVHNVWINDMDGIIGHQCLSFHDKLELCIDYNGDNNFRA